MSIIKNQLSNHVASIRASQISTWSEQFSNQDISILSNVLPRSFEEKFIKEARYLIANNSQRRELVVKESGGTPRAYDSVGRDEIRKNASFIPAVFDSEPFCELLSSIAGQKLHRVPYEPEEFIINSQSKVNDNHGWHWDDYAFALIWCIDEPDPLSGGRIEYIPKVNWDKKNPKNHIRNTLRSHTVRSIHLKEGECYLMKANTCLHRITSLTADTKRTVIVMTYASTSDLSDSTITHGSMEEIYPEISEQVHKSEAA